MPDSTRPNPFRPGDSIRHGFLNKLAGGMLQSARVTGGTMRRVGTNLVLGFEPQRSSAASSFYAMRIDCPDENNKCHVHQLSGDWATPTEGSDSIQVYCPPNCLTATVQVFCIVVAAAGMDPPWIIQDIVPWAPRVPVTGSYTEVSGPLAPYQLGANDAACS